MKIFILALILSAIMSISVVAQANIQGVWQLTEITMSGKFAMTMKVTQPSVYIFTKTHYSKIYVASDKPRPVLDDYKKANGEQLYSIFVEGLDASGGTYEAKAGGLTLHPIVAKSPSDMKDGAWSTYSMKVDSDTIILTPESSNDGPSSKTVTFKLTKVKD